MMPLAQEGWCSVHTVLDEKCFWEIIGKLKALGAEGILVLPICLLYTSGLKVGGSYKLLPFLKLGAGYETHYRNRGADEMCIRDRL